MFLALCGVPRSVEPLSFDTLAETDVIRRSQQSERFLCPPLHRIKPGFPLYISRAENKMESILCEKFRNLEGVVISDLIKQEGGVN